MEAKDRQVEPIAQLVLIGFFIRLRSIYKECKSCRSGKIDRF